ncbi:MAG TPA: DnaJ domain-containing protein [Thermodesulfobacteriota bacterium]|nr:DnaJ domain-containing protein [Thermodesulfobacteriota bacterium]
MKKNYYKVLGVNQKAGPEKIKRAYRQAAKRYHPDVSPQSGEKFRNVQEAYETLSNPEKKALYDREVLEKRSPAAGPQSYYSYSLRSDPSGLFNEIDQFFGRFEDLWIDQWSDLFDERDQIHTDLSVEITLTPSEAREGCKVPLKIPIWESCRSCGGSGFVGELICGLCRGRGEERSGKKMRVTLPPGVTSGTKMRISLRDLGLKGVYLIATIKVTRL